MEEIMIETRSYQKYVSDKGLPIVIPRHKWLNECIKALKKVSINDNGQLRVTRESDDIIKYVKDLHQLKLKTQQNCWIYNDIFRYIRRLKNTPEPYYTSEDKVYFTIIEQYFIRYRIENGNN
jgi:hypothetical protein